VLLQTRTGVRLGVALALSAAACGGKSSGNEANSTAGDAAEAGAGARMSSGGAHSSGGGTHSTGGGAHSSGGMASTSGGVTNGGAGLSCVAPDGSVQDEFRSCLIDSDCGVFVQPTCCQTERVIGVAKYLMCVATPPDRCSAVDCESYDGFQTDDGQRTLNFTEIAVFCHFSTSAAGSCQTTLIGGNMDEPLVCGATACDSGELCVHRSARGGPPPRCVPVPADGVCPTDTEYRAECYSEPGCIELLIEPEPQCAAMPPGCGASAGCSCLPPELCGAPQTCKSVGGNHVYCMDESP
jgi:hypothetical protein